MHSRCLIKKGTPEALFQEEEGAGLVRPLGDSPLRVGKTSQGSLQSEEAQGAALKSPGKEGVSHSPQDSAAEACYPHADPRSSNLFKESLINGSEAVAFWWLSFLNFTLPS